VASRADAGFALLPEFCNNHGQKAKRALKQYQYLGVGHSSAGKQA
jgi:hypothetical protein